jgi:hypothetical protein
VLFTAFICCCFGAATVVVGGFVVIVCCVGGGGGDDDDDDDTADVGGADGNEGFTVLGIPHMRASVVLTTLRSGLLGSHIFALSSDDIGLLTELLVGGDNVGEEEDDC